MILSLFSLTGCSKQTSTSNIAPVTLYWWRSLEDAKEADLQELITQFQSANPNITIKLVLKDPRTYEQEAIDALASHQTVTNAPDILSLRGEDLPKYSMSLSTAPDNILNTQDKTYKTAIEGVNDQFVQAASESVILNDPTSNTAKVYGLPIAIDTLALYRNQTVVQNSISNLNRINAADQKLSQEQIDQITQKMRTAPKTWQDLVDIIPYLKVTSGQDISQAAIALGESTNVERSYDILASIMMQNGTNLISDKQDSATFNLAQTGTVAQNNPGQKALEFFGRFSNPADPLYTWNKKMPDSVDAFETGQTAMMMQYASAYRFIINEAPQMKDSIDVSALPQVSNPDSPTATSRIKTMSRMWVETAPSSKGDANAQAASWQFIKYVTDITHATPYLNAIKLPSARKDTSNDNALFDAFNKQKTIADTWFKGVRAQEVDKIFIGMIDAFKGGKPSKDALDLAASQITTILQASKVKWGNSS